MRGIPVQGDSFTAAIDIDELTAASSGALSALLLKRIAEDISPVAAKIAKTSHGEIFDYLLQHGWKFETYEQFNEARIIEEKKE
jgi:hypothetical protein